MTELFRSRPKDKVCREASRRSPCGFSLVEVLVALTIFALSAIILGSSYVNVLNSYAVASRTAQTSEDVAFARSLVITQADITKLQDGGEFDSATPGRHVKWSAEITPTTTADVFTVVFTCEIGDPTTSAPEKTVQTFTLLRPTWSIDPAARSQLRQDAKNRINELQGKTADTSAGTGGGGTGKIKGGGGGPNNGIGGGSIKSGGSPTGGKSSQPVAKPVPIPGKSKS